MFEKVGDIGWLVLRLGRSPTAVPASVSMRWAAASESAARRTTIRDADSLDGAGIDAESQVAEENGDRCPPLGAR